MVPLTGEAKKEYQREWVRQKRAKGSTRQVRQIEGSTVEPKRGEAPLVTKQETLTHLRQIIEAAQSKSSSLEEQSNTRLYNPLAPQIGKRVRMPSGDIVVVPEMDDEGSQIPEKGAIGQLVSANLFKPSFQPDPKPEKRKRK